MKLKFYSFILMVFCCGLGTARAQNTTLCNAQFTAGVSGLQVFFMALDSASGVQHFWNFGDSGQVGFGPYTGVTHTYSSPGTYRVLHMVRDSATGCQDSLSQLVTVGTPPPAQCAISFMVSHDSTKPGQPYSFFAQPNLAGATFDSVTWTVNDTIAGNGDTLTRTFQTGVYTVCANLVTNLGCQSQSCQTIPVGNIVPPPPQCSISVTFSHDSTHPRQPYFFSAQTDLAGATSGNITWTIDGQKAGMGGSLKRGFPTGQYTVCATLVTDSGCQSQSCQTIGVTDSSSDLSVPPADTAGQSIHSFPNPASGVTNLVITLDKAEVIAVRVYNSMGSQVETLTISGLAGTNMVTVPLSSLQSGIYYIQLQFGNEIKRSMIQKL